MVSKVSRRNFLKGAAAMTVAAAASTLLAGCSGNGGNDVPDPNTVMLGDYKVKVIKVTGSQNQELGSEDLTGSVIPEVSIAYSGTGFTGLSYKDVFSATMGDKEMKLNKAGMILSKDFGSLNGMLSSFVSYKPEFKMTNTETYKNFVSGKADMKLKVTLDKESAVFTIKYNGTITVAKV